MDITARVRDLADRAQQQLPRIKTEEATKFALINPFIREVLGYNTADLTEVVPEYTADVGVKKGEKVDYAILHDGAPLVLIEAKQAGTRLHEEEPSQLYRYFTVTHSARFGIYTDGVKYLFYSDLDKDNLMDRKPFLVLDLQDLDPIAVDAVSKFVKSEFNPDAIRTSANQLKYTRAVKELLQAELHEPSEDLVRLLMRKVYTGTRTPAKVQQFTEFVKQAARQLVSAELRGKLNAALATESDPAASEPGASPAPLPAFEGEVPIRWRHKGQEYHAVLLQGGSVRLPDGTTTKTPSGACSATLGRKININGWDAWHYYNEQQGKWIPINPLRMTPS